MYSIQLTASEGRPVLSYDNAEEAMTAVNRLRVQRVAHFLIRNAKGDLLTDRQLAMIVMEARSPVSITRC